ncbi:MAG: hypothetical protein IRZ16_01310 [Myxococcaceae bacterium]|nr:hypothetical protein [Myxococcaceae bacterium]
MSIDVETGTTLKFERFWKWLREHANCILRAGTDEVWLFDDDDLHWHLEEDAHRSPVVQLMRGKRVLAELVMDVRDVLFVQATPEGQPQNGEQPTLFELVTAGGDENFGAYHFLMAHGFDREVAGHVSGLKH